MTTTINASTSAGLIQSADTSGILQLQTVNLPAVTVDASQNTTVNNNLTVNSNLTVTGSTTLNTSVIRSGTVQASTSGTSITFTGIPSWVKRITVMFNGVSTSGTSILLIQIGSGSITNTGYISQGANGTTSVPQTTGFGLGDNNTAALTYHGNAVLNLINANTWTFSSSMAAVNKVAIGAGGSPSLAGALDRVRITTVNGTDTFDAGSINILYE